MAQANTRDFWTPTSRLFLLELFRCCSTTMTKEDKAKSPKAKKTKEVNAKEVEVEAVPYEVRMKAVTVISKPMASEKQVRSARACGEDRNAKPTTRYRIIWGYSGGLCAGCRASNTCICYKRRDSAASHEVASCSL